MSRSGTARDGYITQRNLHYLIPEWLGEQREWDARGFSPQRGWRPAGAISRGVGYNRSAEHVVTVCELLADSGKLEVRCGDAGWVWYRRAQ